MKETMKRDLIPGLVSLVGVAIVISFMVMITLPSVGVHVLEPINLNLNRTEVQPGETVIVTVEVRNIGKENETFVLELLINGVVEQHKYVTLDVGKTTSRVFFVKKDIEGSYNVEFDGLTETFVVVEPEPLP